MHIKQNTWNAPGNRSTNALNIENKEVEQVKSFKHFGSIVNTDNTMEEEIKKE